jgi:hypothetical protein
MRPCLINYPAWLQRLLACPLKPQQKINILRTYLLPRLFYGLQNSRISAASLKSVDRVTRHYVKKILHMHLHTQDSLIHAPFRAGGLGITELRITIPNVFRSRIRKLSDAAAGDPVIMAALSSATVARLLGRLDAMCGDTTPGEHYHRATCSSRRLMVLPGTGLATHPLGVRGRLGAGSTPPNGEPAHCWHSIEPSGAEEV